MGNRRRAREVSLKILYAQDVAHGSPLLELNYLSHDDDLPAEVVTFSQFLIEGVAQHKKEIDDIIEKKALHWRLSRMFSIDRNVLRLAAFELMYCTDVPVSVIIDEAIELAKKYGTEESASFVNGLLDNIAKLRS